MHTVFALLCFVVVIHWLIFPYPSGLLHWHWGNLTIAPVPAKQPWWIWINTSCEFIMNDCITTTKQSTAKPCAYFLGYTVSSRFNIYWILYWSSLVSRCNITGHHPEIIICWVNISACLPVFVFWYLSKPSFCQVRMFVWRLVTCQHLHLASMFVWRFV